MFPRRVRTPLYGSCREGADRPRTRDPRRHHARRGIAPPMHHGFTRLVDRSLRSQERRAFGFQARVRNLLSLAA